MKIQVAVFWVMKPCGHVVDTNVHPEHEGSVAYETMLSYYITPRCHNPEDRDVN